MNDNKIIIEAFLAAFLIFIVIFIVVLLFMPIIAHYVNNLFPIYMHYYKWINQTLK